MNHVSRRMSVAVVLAGVLVTTACTSSTSSSSSSSGSSGSSASSGTPGASGSAPAESDGGKFTLTAQTSAPTTDLDAVRWGIADDEPASLDWIYNWSYGADNTIQANLCEGLWRQEPSGEITPGLALSVERPDDTTLVYKLRPDVRFHDGSVMTADDVAFSLDRNLSADPPSYWGFWYGDVASISATAADEVTVKLKKPDALFDSLMSTPAGYVGQKSYIEAKGADYGTPSGGVMCTGPYKFGSWNKGESVVIEANDSYWDPNLKPRVKEISFQFLSDPSALANALTTGEVDGAWATALSSTDRLSSTDVGKLYFNEGTTVAMMQLTSLEGPLKDLNVRLAVRSVIDFKGIVAGILGGAGAPAMSIAPPASWGAASPVYQAAWDALPPAVQDLAAAKTLLDQAQEKPTRPIVIVATADNPDVVKAAQAIQASAKSIGLEMEVRPVPGAEFTSLYFDEEARQGVDFMMNTVTVDLPDPLELFVQIGPGSPYNVANIDDPTFADPLAVARQESDLDKRAQHVVEAQTSFVDNMYGQAVYSEYARVFLNNRVTGVAVSDLGHLYYPWAATLGGT
jgi:peptide/nickel transport system substrate-binding protein